MPQAPLQPTTLANTTLEFFKRGEGGAKKENVKALQGPFFVVICNLEFWREGEGEGSKIGAKMKTQSRWKV